MKINKYKLFLFQLYGLKSETLNGVVDHISSLCKFMEECLKEWLQHIREQRTGAYYLNHFTTEQLVILQTELSKVNSDERKDSLSRNIYPLLARVKHNCCLKDLEKAMYLAFRKEVPVQARPSSAAKPLPVVSVAAQDVDKLRPSQEECDNSAKAFLEKMKESGYNNKLSSAALKEVGPNVEEGRCGACFKSFVG